MNKLRSKSVLVSVELGCQRDPHAEEQIRRFWSELAGPLGWRELTTGLGATDGRTELRYFPFPFHTTEPSVGNMGMVKNPFATTFVVAVESRSLVDGVFATLRRCGLGLVASAPVEDYRGSYGFHFSDPAAHVFYCGTDEHSG